jgi:hypothetical protein
MKDMTTKIQNWFMENEPSDVMSYRKAWWNNNVFIRDRIVEGLFNSKEAEVIGTHYSKSIACPVIKTVYKGIEVIWQYNFYCWQIMINNKKDLNLEFLELCSADGDYFYYQGIPDEYQYKPYSKTNKKQFAICISSSDILDVWAFALELRKAISK